MSANPMALIRIVDDEEDMRNSLKFLLEAEGWTVQLYSSADEFLEQDNQMIPGCLILDIHMPGTSGLMLQSKLNDTECPPHHIYYSFCRSRNGCYGLKTRCSRLSHQADQ